MFMAQEEPGLALGLSLGSGAGHHHHHLPQPKEAVPLEPYLSLSLAGAGAVKREEEERALIYCSDDLVEGYNSSGGGGSRKKLRLTKDQTALLEDHFKEQSTLSHKQKASLARQLNLRPRQVEVWFQNRRARTKLKQTEVDCELLKRCCETLTEENRRLHRELQHLRALHHHQHHHPAAAFFMPATATASVCPSCNGAPPAHATDRPATKRSFFATKSAAC
ncbi:homeobox-leucine zipper protein HOX15 [Aegilops tauschii subsp. strangulata]|uniref:Homeobox domain-containing protein n=1 Tax=Aegilops tauschii subsp. strangulata TaxID=200361 RepID=A0A453DMW5_AEGTS|nr:homeobox-leucine zipper protein HOX15 [Aegilops tauschii subsp. strangulata]